MQQLDDNMVRGAAFALKAGEKPFECTVAIRGEQVPAFIVGGSFGRLTLEKGGKKACVNPAYVQVEDEVAETLRSYFERGTANVAAARTFGQGAASRLGSYSGGKLGYRAR